MKRNLPLFLVLIAIIVLPKLGSAQLLSESFEGSFPPTGWLLVNNGSGNNWTQNTNATKASDGTKSMRYALNASNSADAWAFTPALNLTAGTTYTLTFDYKVQAASKPEKLKITVGSAQTVVSQTTTLWDNNGGTNLTNTSFAQASIQFTPTTSGNYYYAFNCYSDANKKRLWVDKVIISAPSSSTCTNPSNQAVTSLTTTSAQLNWLSGGSTNYNIEYGPAGFTQGTGTVVAVATDTFTVVTGLSAGTSYDWYVQDSCGVGDVSSWVGPDVFITNCATYAANYTQDFSTYIPNCWSEAKGLLQTNTTFTSSSSLWTGDGFANNGTTGAARVRIKGQIRSWLISPSIDLSTGNYQLEFDMALTAPGSTTDTTLGVDDSVVVVISTDDGATWNKANKLRVWTTNSVLSSTGSQEIIDLSAYNSTVKIAFYTPSTIANAETDFFIDNFAITPSTNISVDLGNDTTICEGVMYTLNSGNPASYSHLWTVNGDTLSNTSPSISTDSAGVYTVEVSNGVNTAYDTLVIAVNPLPTVAVGNTSYTMCKDDSVQVSLTFAGTAPWNFDIAILGLNTISDSSTSTLFQAYADPDTTISFTIISITDGTGCIQTAYSDTVTITVNPKPTVSIAGLSDLCANSADITLSGGTPANGVYSGTGVNSATATFSAVNAGVGNHTITYSYTDGNGCSDSATSVQTVNDIPNITVSALANPVAYNSSTTLNAVVTNSVGALSYSWTPTASISGSATIQSPTTVNIINATNYIVNITDAGTSCSNNDSILITYSGGPISVSPMANPSSVCLGDTTNLMAQGSGGSGTITYSWTSNPSGFTASGENVDAIPTQDTWYIVQASDGANTTTDSVFVSVKALPSILSVTNDNICFGDSALVSIIFTGNAPYTFTGTENGQLFNASSPSDTLSHYLSATVTTTYILTSLTDNNGCSIYGNLDSLTVLVYDLPTVAYMGSDTICMGETVSATATFTGTAPFDYIYNGVTVSGVNTNSDTQILSPTTDSSFIITSVVDANGCSLTGNLDTIIVKVNSLPVVNLGNDTSVCINHSITLDAGAGFVSYLWNTGATTQTISLDSLDFSVGANDYSVEVSNAVSCSNSDTITLTVDPCTGILVPELAGATIMVYPNPSKGEFQVALSGLQNQKYNFEIYNSLGAKVYSEVIDNNGQAEKNMKINLSSMAKGIYIIRLQSNNKIKVERLIIQ